MAPILSRPRFVLAVPDASITAAWWIDVMGFREDFRTEGWVFVRRDACTIHLGSCPDAVPPSELGDHSYFGYIEIDALNAYHEEIKAKGAAIIAAPTDKPWDMREMSVRTPDGHRIMFGQRL
jgi:catechol 2,3-dioxygenase-like lactoylglutathione lyase family enzyme